MVNVYICIQSILQGFCCSLTHSHTNGYHTRCWPDHQALSEVQYIAKEHFNMWTEGGGDRTTDTVMSGRPTPPLEP